MVTRANTPIAELVEPPGMVVDINEPATDLVRRFDAGAESMTAIVTDAGRPVGVIRRAAAESAAGAGTLVGQLPMEPLPALVRDTMTLGDVIAMDTPADLDRLPVVNVDGMLVGEVIRTNLAAAGGMTDNRAEVVTSAQGEAMPFTVVVGQKVIGSDGHSIGTVKDVVQEMVSGRVAHFVIEEGLLFKKERKIPVDLIDPTRGGDDIHLKVDKDDIARLGTLDDEQNANR